MSPEQVLGEEVDGRSDLYSVGVLFYRLLTGALPFAADTALGMLRRQIRDTPIPLCAHRGGLPDWCETIVQKALNKTQADRFQSAEEFREALSRATGPLPMADIAKTFAAEGRESLVPAPIVTETLDLSHQQPSVAAAPTINVAAPPPAAKRGGMVWAQAAVVAMLAITVAAVGYAMLLRGDATEAATEPTPAGIVQPSVAETEPATARPVETNADADAREEARPVETVRPPAVEPAAPIAAAPRRVANRAATPVAPVVETPAPVDAPEPVERRPARSFEGADPILVFETRALVGTRKSKEQGAQLLMGDGKITIIPTSNPASPLCSFPYGRVLAINVSRGRDPLWNSPQGPAPVARAGGTLSKLGIQVTRDWIALRTSTEEQFVSMRFDEVLMKRVLLALEERTGHQSQFIELPKEKD
jgi:serine/threonine-protein kinase